MASPSSSPAWTDPTTPLTAIASHQLVSLGPEATFGEAVRLIGRFRISSLLVLDDGRPVGILTERSLLQALHTTLPPQTRLREIMTVPVTIPASSRCVEAYHICLREDVRHLVLVDEAHRAVALVSETDFHHHLDLGALAGQGMVGSIMQHSFCMLEPDTPLHSALEQMHGRAAGGVIVVDHHRPVGILSERDLARLYLDPPKGNHHTLAQVMTTPVRTIPLNTTLAEAAVGMHTHRIRQYPVVDASGMLVGLVTSHALIQAMLFGLTDAALEQEKQTLRNLLEQAPLPLLITSRDSGEIRFLNTRAQQQFHLNRESLIGQPVQQLYRNSGQRNHLLHILQRDGTLHDMPLSFTDCRGKVFQALVSATLIDYEHQPAILAAINDITQSRREQRDLRERIKEQQCLTRIFALTEDVTAPFDEQLQQVAEQIASGWQYPEITEARIVFDQTVHATTGFRESPWMQTVEATTAQQGVFQLTVSSLEPWPLEEEAPFLREKRQLAEAIVHRLTEVAERRHTIEAIKARDRLIATMFAQATDAIVLVESQTHGFVDFNTAAHAGLGYTSEEFARLQIQDIQVDHSPQQIAAIIREIAMGRHLSCETRHRHKDGTIRAVALTMHPISLGDKTLISAVWRDITEQKAREQALEASEKRLKAITDSALDAILMLDCRANISYWNPAAETTFGYRAEEVMGTNLHHLLAPPRYLAEYQATFPDFLTAGTGKMIGKTIELFALRKDGQEIVISLSLSSVRLNNQWHAVGIVRDISELKRNQAALEQALEEAETANRAANEVLTHLEELVNTRTAELDAVNDQLRISEERYTHAMAATNDGLWDWNMLTGDLYCSPAHYRMIGYEPGELAPNQYASGFDRIHPEDLKPVAKAIQQKLVPNGNLEMEFRMIAKDGSPIWLLSRGKVVERNADGRAVRAVGIHTDITERKRLEMELRAAAAQQQAIFEAAAMGIVVVKSRIIRQCNRRLEELFGYDPGEFIGKSTRIWYDNETNFREIGREVQRHLQNAGVHNGEHLLVRKDGSRFWARMRAQALDRSDLGKGLVGMVDDITQERQAADLLRNAKDAAEAATRAKSEFLAKMSHEIRTPMNAILGFAHLIKREPLTPQQSSQLDKLAEASRHLLRVINDILDLSKIEANKMTLAVDDFEPAQVVDQVCGILVDKAREKNLELRAELHQIPQVLRGDASRLGQILLNLVGNAVKFTEQGHIDIAVQSVDPHQPDTIVLRFTVQDTGIGMTEDQVERVFHAFEQADGSTTRRFGGTGLGLAISKQLVELMGGRIGLESRIGQGSLFWLEIPFALSARSAGQRMQDGSLLGRSAPARDPSQESGEMHRRGARILLVEDNIVNQEVARMLLESMGMEVTVAENGAVAVTLAGQESFDLVFMDVQMPIMNGLEATRAIRRIPGRQALPILAMTANAFSEDRERCLQAGMNDHIAKPIELEKLHTLLNRWVPVRQPQPSSLAIADEPAWLDHLSRPQQTLHGMDTAMALPPVSPRSSPPTGEGANAAMPDIRERLRGIAGLDVESGLERLRGDQAGYLRLLAQFVRQHGGDAELLAAFLQTREYTIVREQAHTLKGAAATLGVRDIARMAADMEQGAGGPHDETLLLARINELRPALHTFCTMVDQVAADCFPTEPPLVVDLHQARSILQRLEGLLTIEDSAVNDEFAGNRNMLIAAYALQAKVLGRQIEAFDYGDALETVRMLLNR